MSEPRHPMPPHRRLALWALVLALLGPLLCLACAVGHGMGPCGPANLSGLLGCGGFLICIPAALILAIAALFQLGKAQQSTFHQRERDRFWKQMQDKRDE